MGATAVGLTQDDCAISVRFHGYCTGTVQQPCGNCARAVRMPHDSTIAVRFVFDSMFTENRTFAACTRIVQWPQYVYELWAYDF